MAQYRAKGPDGRMYNFEGPGGLSKTDASFFLNQYFALGADQPEEELALKPVEPKAETGFIPSVKRGFAQTGMLLGDVLPAMAARAVGADEYADRQLKEAAATQKEIEKKYPSAVPSFTDIKGAGDAVSYIVEAVGESIPSILPGIFTGGAASLLGRGAVVAAKEAAEKAAMNSIAKGLAVEEAEKVAMQAGVQAARRTALKYEASGALAGSATQNIPEVYQNILESTGKEDLGAALIAGGFNSVLDAIMPIQLLRKAKLSGIPEEEIIGAWYKRGAAGLGKGFVTEGGTEAVQEMSSAAAEAFVDKNQDFFTPKNFVRFLDAGLKGGIGGGVITGASDIAFGRAPTKQEAGAAPTGEETDALASQILAKAGVVPPTTPEGVPQIAPGALEAIKPVAPPAPAPAAPAAPIQSFLNEKDKASPVVKDIIEGMRMVLNDNPGAKPGKLIKLFKDKTGVLAAPRFAHEAVRLGPLTATLEEGATDVERPVSETSGTSVPVSEPVSDTNAPAGGAAAPERLGVVPAGQDVTGAVAGEAAAPDTVRPNPFAPDDPNSWQDSAGHIHYKMDAPFAGGKGRVTELIDQEQSQNIALKFTDSKGNQDRTLSVGFNNAGVPYWSAGGSSEAAIKLAIGDTLYNALGNAPIKNTEEYQALVQRIKTALEMPPQAAAEITEEQEAAPAPYIVKKSLQEERKVAPETSALEELTADEIAAIDEEIAQEGNVIDESDPLLEYALIEIAGGQPVDVEEFANTHGITNARAEVLYDEAREILAREGFTETDTKIDDKEVKGSTEEKPKRAKKPKGAVTATGRETRTGRGEGGGRPQYVDRELANNNSLAFLNNLRTSPDVPPIMRVVAQYLYQKRIFPQIKVVNSLPEGRAIQYNPRTREVEVVPRLLREETANEAILHEFVHDATIKVLYAYKNGGKLTNAQYEGASHIEYLMNFTKSELGGTFPRAYDDIYEFASYAMSNPRFMKELAKINIPANKSILAKSKRAWSNFVAAISKLFNLDNVITQQGTAAMETFAAFETIVAPSPAGGVEMAPLPFTEEVKQAAPIKAPSQMTDEELVSEALKQTELKEHGVRKKISNYLTKRGAIWLTEHFQNDRYRLKRWEDREALLGRINRIDSSTLNNVFGQITRSAGMGVDIFNTHMKTPSEELHAAVDDYAKKLDITTKEALSRLHLILEVRHEPERRRVKYILKVPLDQDADQKIVVADLIQSEGLRGMFGNTNYSPAAFRDEVLRVLSKPMEGLDADTRKAYAKELRAAMDKVVDDSTNHPVIVKTVSPKGKIITRETKPADFDESSEIYNVIANRSPREIAALRNILDTKTDAKEINNVAKAVKAVTDKSIELNKEANYFSAPTQNVVDFYGYENYVPFKGRPGREQIDEELNIGSRRVGGELQEGQDRFEGRLSESENPILQTLADGASAALRAGRKDLTLAIKNAIAQKILPGKRLDNIKFEERYLGDINKEAMAGPDKIFHYNPDGTIDILQVSDKLLSEAIRRQYRESSPVIDQINRFTSGLGMMHTRYNPAFAPMNFVRDALTNAFTLGAEFGPAEAGRLLTQISADVASGGMAKALKYSILYSKGKFDEINKLAETDPYFKDMQEYVKMGGRVSYLQGVAAKGALDKLIEEVGVRQVGANKIATLLKKKQIDDFLDIYNEMFELSSRVATFRIMRDNLTKKNIDKGMAKADATKDASIQAVEYAKNLANFEQVGRWGKEAGALFMFFRPAATGAVRAIEALAPAFMPFDAQEFRLEAKQSGATDEQIDNAIKTIKNRKAAARRMAAGLTGLGMMMYWIAVMMAGDDDEGRNRVLTDDMARWTRYARFAIPGTDVFLQIPWGFGLGFFASFGAQMAAVLTGKSSIGDAVGNSVPTFLDSFLPLPVSRMNFIDNPGAWLVDSALPSLARPIVEYQMNLDGLGREIYNNRQSRYGDAYTGGDNIPETYKAAARTLFNMSKGAIDVSPNSLYFFASNYFDGIAKTLTGVANLGMSAAGYKDADIRNDMPLVASFIGSKSNVDAREFSKVEDQIKGMEKRINSMKDKPEMLSSYLEDHATDYALVQFYNQAVNGTLRQLRSAANQIRANSELTPKERKAQVDEIVKMQNGVKRDLLNAFEAVGGVRP